MPRAAVVATLVLGLAAAARAAAGGEPPELQIYAAASLRDALEELSPALERATGARPVLNLGASSDLARQIVAANKADLFFSADPAWMDHVAAAGLVDADSRRAPLANRLAVVVPADSPVAIGSAADLARPGIRRLSLANPEVVPAGKYARAWLESRGAWREVEARVIPALDVRAALAAVAAGAADAGIVYRTDAAISQRVRVALEVPESEGPPITYALAALRDRPHLEVARAAVAWLCGPEAARVFERLGFVVRGGAP
jgi:molybdate transport system substrate-binding protein